MQTMIFIYSTLIVSIIVFSYILTKIWKKIFLLQKEISNLDEILNACPNGYYYEVDMHEQCLSYCSKNLCLFINASYKKLTFRDLLSYFDPNDRETLHQGYINLKSNHVAFNKNAKLLNQNMFFSVHGRILHSDDKTTRFVVWFKDITQEILTLEIEKSATQKLLFNQEILTQSLNILPIPICIKNKNNDPCFSNKFYSKESEENANIHWISNEFKFDETNELFSISYGQDKSTEEGLNALLNDAEKTTMMLLKELPFGVALYNAFGHLTYFNANFQAIWHLETSFLKKDPLFLEVIDKIQEKGLLPQIKDFSQYKKSQQNNFLHIRTKTEEYLYLSNNEIVKRILIPSIKGSILILDVKITNQTNS